MRKFALLCVSVLALGVFFIIPSKGNAAKGIKRPVMGWISFKPSRKQEGVILIMARAFAVAGSGGRYVLTVKRKTGGGVSTSRQSGHFTLEAGQTSTLSKTGINIPKNSVFRASLELHIAGKVVFSAVLDNKL